MNILQTIYYYIGKYTCPDSGILTTIGNRSEAWAEIYKYSSYSIELTGKSTQGEYCG